MLMMHQRNILLCCEACVSEVGMQKISSSVAKLVCRKWGCKKISSSVHGALAELIGEVSRRDGGVRKYLFNQSEPPRHFVPLPLCAPQTGGDNLSSRCEVRDTVSTPLSLRATPPICSANRGRQSRQPAVWSEIEHQPPRHFVPLPYVLRKQGETILPAGGVGSEIEHQPPRHFVPLPLCAPQTGGDNLSSRWGGSPVGMQEISSSVHGALAELIGEVSRRDGGVGDRASTPSSRCATPPMCSANRGRQSRQPAVWVRDTVSTPSSRCATPPICSANRGRQSCRQRG